LPFDIDKVLTDDEYRMDCRFRFETDHFYAAEVLGFDRFNRKVHTRAVELYPPKNRNLPIPEQDTIHQRLHLDPRFTFKTTLGRVDDMQWLAAFPEIVTILEESATQALAKSICTSLGMFCVQGSHVGKRFRMLYPELVIEKQPWGEWNTPLHRSKSADIDASVAFTSPGSQQSGWHPWILNPDDMVDTENSGIHASDETRKRVISTYYTNRNTLQPGGFLNVRGTRYHPFDLYGDIIGKMDPKRWKVLIRQSVIVKDGARLMPGEFPREQDLEMPFAELPGMDYGNLRDKFFADYESFQCQQQNDPQGGAVPVFDERLYTAALCEEERIPVMGETIMVLRIPYQGKKFMATHAEAVVGRIAAGKVFVLDAWRGVYQPSGLAEKVVKTYRAHDCEWLMCEDVPGLDGTLIDIRNEGAKKNRSIRVVRSMFLDDDNVRRSQIIAMEPVLKTGRIVLSTGVTAAAEMRKQIIHFGLIQENGIIDGIAKLTQRVPLSLVRSQMDEDELELQIRRRESAQFNAVFAQHGMPAVDELARQRAAATVQAMESAGETAMFPPLPGGLDG
jgi:hypothetical protein